MTVPDARSAPARRTRRARVREATVAEIKTTARGLLVQDGISALTVRAIAREMGLTAPALYRYFAGHEELVTAVCQDILDEITETIEAARDTVGSEDPVGRLMAACRAFRTWSLAHRREFQLTFASPVDRAAVAPGDVEIGASFGAVFHGLFAEMWAHGPFPVPDESDLPPALVEELRRFSARVGSQLPLGVLVSYLGGWVRLYGAVTIEVFGHLGFALADPEPMFEAMLADMRRALEAPVS